MSELRPRWSSKLIFIFAVVGSAVGLGNVWRFPYLVGKHGGGAFLIPYLLILIVIGIPFLIMEFAIGQKMQAGAIKTFRTIDKRLAGIGLGAILCSFILICYYAVVMAWFFLYSIFSFKLSWGTDTKKFFFEDVLHVASVTADNKLQFVNLSEIGFISTPILLALFICWLLIYFSVWKGVRSVEKVVAITMPLPIILLIILLIRGISLPGASDGLAYYLIPHGSNLKAYYDALFDREIWAAAASQIFFTLSIGFGVMLTYASYQDNKHSDITKSAIITAGLNSFVSLTAGFVVFSVVGYMAHDQGSTVEDIAAGGPGLAFIVFPQALSLLPGAAFFAVIFFIMLLTLAIDSAFSLVEAITEIVQDRFPYVRRQDLVLYVCILAFAGGIIFTTHAGLHYLDIIDHFLTYYALLICGLAQSIVIGWVYGAKRLRTYINEVSDIRLGVWWEWSIQYIIPVFLLTLLSVNFIEDWQTPYENYPAWALKYFGWGLIVVIVGIAFIYSFVRTNTTRSE